MHKLSLDYKRYVIYFFPTLVLQTVGCDGIVGSGAVVDRCGVCNGNNRDCQTISGIYTRASLPYGYNLITRIPEGACNINITELGSSRNYLGKSKL